MTIACSAIRPDLSEYVDGHLDAERTGTIRAHLSVCDACQAITVDLGRVRHAARRLGPIQPPAHLWIEIAGRVRQERHVPGPVAAPPAPVEATTASTGRVSEGTWQWLGLAAALTLVTLGVYTVGQSGPDEPVAIATDTAGNAGEVPTVETVEETMRRAEAEYEKAIAQLEEVLKNGSPGVSGTAVVTLQHNLTMIDSAIAETRAALTDNPESRPARVSLFEALRSKVTLLQQTVVLMNAMRQGDATGAAEAAADMTGRGRGTL